VNGKGKLREIKRPVSDLLNTGLLIGDGHGEALSCVVFFKEKWKTKAVDE